MSEIAPLLWRNFEARGYTSAPLSSTLGFEISIPHKLTNETLYASEEATEELVFKIDEKIRDDISFYRPISNKCRETGAKFLEFCEIIGSISNYNRFPDAHLEKLFDEYMTLNIEMVTYRPVVAVLDELLNNLIEERVQEIGGFEFPYQDIVPSEKLEFVKRREDLLRIVEELKGYPELVELITEHDPDYAWDNLPRKFQNLVSNHMNEFQWVTTMRYIGDPLTRNDVLSQLSDLLLESEDKLMNWDSKRSEKINVLTDLKQKYPELSDTIEIAREYAYLRTYRRDIVHKGDFYIRDLLKYLARDSGIDYKDVIYHTIPEIRDMINGKAIDHSILDDRKESFVLYVIDDSLFLAEGGLAEELQKEKEIGSTILEIETASKKNSINRIQDYTLMENPILVESMAEPAEFLPEIMPKSMPPQDTSEPESKEYLLTGRSAALGEVEGQVKMVHTIDDIKSLNEGEIIVSKMARPDMTPWMERAGGIVTDEGGLSSHAAIISREFDIPCVTDTGLATQKLEEGDEIRLRVNEDNGIIERL